MRCWQEERKKGVLSKPGSACLYATVLGTFSLCNSKQTSGATLMIGDAIVLPRNCELAYYNWWVCT
eukprot:1155093-Pelagomonas_calceolata.AAC.4